MKISIMVSNRNHPVISKLNDWVKTQSDDIEVNFVTTRLELTGGDILFLISCNEVIPETVRKLYSSVLVIHASDLPWGRGWSPHIWQILDGEEIITVTLLEAADKVDTGDIWKQTQIHIPKDTLYDEINEILFKVELELMEYAIKNQQCIKPRKQSTLKKASYYPKRTPDDSELDPYKNIVDQFNLMRVCDPDRFPAFFRLHGHKYKISLEKLDSD